MEVAPVAKNPPADAGGVRDMGLIPGGGHGNPLQYSYLENPRDREEPCELHPIESHRFKHD